MTDSDLVQAILLTGIGSLVTWGIVMIAWSVSGAWIRKNNVASPNRHEADRAVTYWTMALVLLLVTIPIVINFCGNSYPIPGGLVGYFMLLSLAAPCMIVRHFLKTRRQPSQYSVFVIILGLLVITVTIYILGIFVSAIASSAYT